MAHSVSVPGFPAVAAESASTESARIPWHVWSYVVAATSAVIGGVWDISWHKSIGRDTFWTPAHIAIYLCGVLAGLTSAWLILSTTFGKTSALRQASVQMWRFRGPLGAFLCAWGGLAMIASAPFDDWWHNAYGLDVKILSPPHVVLILGIMAIRFGALIQILGTMNRASGALRARLGALFLYMAAIIMGGLLGAFQEFTTHNYMHSALFYLLIAIVAPLCLIAPASASGKPWAATTVAAIYTLLLLLSVWIFPLFPAEPKLGPVYFQVTHFLPGPFPLLLLPGAAAIDLVRRRMAGSAAWKQSIAAGLAFLGALVAVQWPFAEFLMSPAAHNRFFGIHYMPFFVPPTSDYARFVFTTVEQTAAQFWTRLAIAALMAVVSARLGLGWASWMRQVRR
jgi:hypothetical protein